MRRVRSSAASEVDKRQILWRPAGAREPGGERGHPERPPQGDEGHQQEDGGDEGRDGAADRVPEGVYFVFMYIYTSLIYHVSLCMNMFIHKQKCTNRQI